MKDPRTPLAAHDTAGTDGSVGAGELSSLGSASNAGPHEHGTFSGLPAEYRARPGRAPDTTVSEEQRERRWADGRVEAAFLRAITNALLAWQPLNGAGESLLRDLAEVLGLSAGVLWLPDSDVLAVGATWCAEGVDREALEIMLKLARFGQGVGLPGSAWQRGEPLYQTIATARESSQGQAPLPGGPWAFLAIPARMHDEVLGVIELYLPLRRRSRLTIPPLAAAVHLLGGLLDRWRMQKAQPKLTTRELECLTLAAHGLNSKMIAEQLWLSPATVKTHFEHIRLKLKVPNRAAAVTWGLREGIIGWPT
jgi:DNA-binding CsgD family transcriptional regulator